MIHIQQKVNENGEGGFYIANEAEQLGEMAISVKDKILTVYHTEVLEKAEGTGLAKQLLNAMAEFVRKNNMKVIPLCTYVNAQFRRHPAEYSDIWLRDEV